MAITEGPPPRAATIRRAPGRPAAEPEPRRRKIIAAAIDLFIAEGYVGATIDELARRSGLNKRSIYTLVGSKEQLFREACRNVAINGELDLSDAIDQSSLRNSLINLGHRLLANSLSKRTIALEQTAIAASRQFPEYIDEVVKGTYDDANRKVAEFLLDLDGLGLIKISDAISSSELFFDVMIGQLAHRMALGQRPFLPEIAYIERRVDIFICCHLQPA